MTRMTTEDFYFAESGFNNKLCKSILSVSSVCQTGGKFTFFQLDNETERSLERMKI